MNDYGTSLIFESDSQTFKFNGFDGEYLNFYLEDRVDQNNKYKEEYKILPKDILFAEVSTLGENPYAIKGKASSFFFSGRAIGYNVTYDKGKTVSNKRSSMIIFFSEDRFKDAQRLFKAIMHLAKLSGADELPKVTEDTF